jgi:hypothetical protein
MDGGLLMRVDIPKLIRHLKRKFPKYKISVRFVDKLPKDECEKEYDGDATHKPDGTWLIRIHRGITNQQMVSTILHEFAHVSRGIPSRKDPHDKLFNEHLGRVFELYRNWNE